MHALGAGGADVVLSQHVEHAGFGQTGDIGHGIERQRDHRQHVVGIAGRPHAHPLQLQAEDQQQNGGQNEAGHRNKQRGHKDDHAVRPAAAAERRHRSQHQPDDERQQGRHAAQRGGYRERFGDHVRNLTSRLERNAEIAVRQVAQVDQELFPHWLIQMEALHQHGFHRRVLGLFTGKRPAGDGVHGKKGDGRDDEYG